MKEAGWSTLDSTSPHKNNFPAAWPVTVAAVYSPQYRSKLYAISIFIQVHTSPPATGTGEMTPPTEQTVLGSSPKLNTCKTSLLLSTALSRLPAAAAAPESRGTKRCENKSKPSADYCFLRDSGKTDLLN